MAVNDKAAKRRRLNSNSEDRLSNLPDDTLIEIISHLPLQSAVVTGSLSRQWRGLWTNSTSVDISSRRLRGDIYTLSSFFRNIMMQIRSPLLIHNFSLELHDDIPDWQATVYPWLQLICRCNVQTLKLTWPDYSLHPKPVLPCNFFQIRSLVCVDLDKTFGWEFPSDYDPIILPNLKKLSLKFHGSQHKCIQKLINMSSSLEDLSLTLEDNKGTTSCNIMNYSHPNLRRLSLKLDINYKTKVVINSPNLDYLKVCGRYDTVFCFEEEPVALSEANIQLSDHGRTKYKGKKKSMRKFYEAISNVETLTLDVLVLYYFSGFFSNVTRLTLNMRSYYLIDLPASILEKCLGLEVLTIKFGDVCSYTPWLTKSPKLVEVSTLPRVLKRIEIEYFLGEHYYVPQMDFLHLLDFLLFSSNSIASERFNFRLTGDKYCKMECVEREIRLELDLFELFKKLPMNWVEGEVQFVGKYCKLSRRAHEKVPEGRCKVINFSCRQKMITSNFRKNNCFYGFF